MIDKAIILPTVLAPTRASCDVDAFVSPLRFMGLVTLRKGSVLRLGRGVCAAPLPLARLEAGSQGGQQGGRVLGDTREVGVLADRREGHLKVRDLLRQ